MLGYQHVLINIAKTRNWDGAIRNQGTLQRLQGCNQPATSTDFLLPLHNVTCAIVCIPLASSQQTDDKKLS